MKSAVAVFLVLSSSFFFAQSGHAFGFRRTPHQPPPSSPTATPVIPTPPTASTQTCVSTDPNHICLGVKLVSYTKDAKPELTRDQANTLIGGINQVWSQCNIGFQLETYQAVDPAAYGLSYQTNWEQDGDTVRSAFDEKNTFLVVAVGALTGSTIAVTEMPGAGIYGVLVEQAFANNALTVGHELGHYQGLYHIRNNSNLMNPYIGANTSRLNASQCATARDTDYSNWQNVMRYPASHP